MQVELCEFDATTLESYRLTYGGRGGQKLKYEVMDQVYLVLC